jgi:hypothetical protein
MFAIKMLFDLQAIVYAFESSRITLVSLHGWVLRRFGCLLCIFVSMSYWTCPGTCDDLVLG